MHYHSTRDVLIFRFAALTRSEFFCRFRPATGRTINIAFLKHDTAALIHATINEQEIAKTRGARPRTMLSHGATCCRRPGSALAARSSIRNDFGLELAISPHLRESASHRSAPLHFIPKRTESSRRKRAGSSATTRCFKASIRIRRDKRGAGEPLMLRISIPRSRSANGRLPPTAATQDSAIDSLRIDRLIFVAAAAGVKSFVGTLPRQADPGEAVAAVNVEPTDRSNHPSSSPLCGLQSA